ncbi:MAG: Na+/H+ antiporter subunit B [Deltaproteobacteria bacterium]|nr:Na+/H+ antiporter subunit B [Deltaproteobacteria bacterium]
MTSLILRTTARYLLPLLVMFSFFLVVRGHNEPGGGFVAGLIAASAWALYALAYSPADARRTLWIEPILLIALGLLLAAASGVLPFAMGEPFLTGIWFELPMYGLTKMKIGTPLLFDVGVYLLVWGATLTIILAAAEE